MNIKDLLSPEKAVSTTMLFKSDHASVKAIQILQGEQLKEHVTDIPALLICVIGNVVFENEKGVKETLLPGDYVWIDPMIKHWLNAIAESRLLLLK